MPDHSSHTAFRIAAEALQAGRQMRLSVVTLALLTLAIGLGASAIRPHAGWLENASHGVAADTLVDARGAVDPQG